MNERAHASACTREETRGDTKVSVNTSGGSGLHAWQEGVDIAERLCWSWAKQKQVNSMNKTILCIMGML
eukprot:452284-Pleurochrysis_carterae.AAC.2